MGRLVTSLLISDLVKSLISNYKGTKIQIIVSSYDSVCKYVCLFFCRLRLVPLASTVTIYTQLSCRTVKLMNNEFLLKRVKYSSQNQMFMY